MHKLTGSLPIWGAWTACGDPTPAACALNGLSMLKLLAELERTPEPRIFFDRCDAPGEASFFHKLAIVLDLGSFPGNTMPVFSMLQDRDGVMSAIDAGLLLEYR